MRIKSIKARQILNGKGLPTLQVEVSTPRYSAMSSVPIAASKSKYEFFDSYDNHPNKFQKATLEKISYNIEKVVGPELIGLNSMDQEKLDHVLLALDSTLDRSNIGVNSMAAISQAVAKLGALESDLPLYKYIRVLYDYTGHAKEKLHSVYRLPLPVVTLYQSSTHNKENALPCQEILLLPKRPFAYYKDLVPFFEQISSVRLSKDEIDLASFVEHVAKKFSSAKVKLGIDMAASKYWRHETNKYTIPNLTSTKIPFHGDAHKLLKFYYQLVSLGHLSFIEDFFAEDDYASWKSLVDLFENEKVQVVSDDLTATNVERLEKVDALSCCNNVVLKPSQSGTVTETIHFAQEARDRRLRLTMSYRHGETEDQFISDLAVGLGAEYIRTGPHKGSEYISKINRLVQIEDEVM